MRGVDFWFGIVLRRGCGAGADADVQDDCDGCALSGHPDDVFNMAIFDGGRFLSAPVSPAPGCSFADGDSIPRGRGGLFFWEIRLEILGHFVQIVIHFDEMSLPLSPMPAAFRGGWHGDDN